MTKIILSLSWVVAATCTANAQTETGKIVFGGHTQYDNRKIEDADNFKSISIYPGFSVFVEDHLALGLWFGRAWYQSDHPDKERQEETTVGPFARLYIGEGDIRLLAQLSIPRGRNIMNVNGTEVGYTDLYRGELAPGIVYFPTDKLGIELMIRGMYYQHSTWKPKEGDKETSRSYGLNANSLIPRIGVQFYL